LKTPNLLILLFLLSWSCNKEEISLDRNSKGEIEYLKPLWKIPLYEDNDASIFKPALFGNWGFGNQALLVI